MNCIICNGQQLKLLRKAVRDDPNTSVVRCLRCGHYQLYPLPKESELEKFYNEDGQVKSLFSDEVKIHDIRMKVSTDIMRRAEYVKKIVGDQKNKQILDIGTGYGFFVEHMEKQGYKIEGIEIGRARREVAERICFSPIYSYNLVDELPDKMVSRYDIIVLFQVLEHIVSVNTFLKNIYKMMTKDAVLIIEVPNVDDHMLKISSSYNNFFGKKPMYLIFLQKHLEKY